MEKRIEYIDAMRGFTMLLVVYSHVRLFGFHESDTEIVNSFNSIFILIRMPLFFFVSGFLFYKKEWNKTDLLSFIIKKAKIQILPALFFMIIYAYIFNYNVITGLFDCYKLGYWFTFTLFSFFITYFIINYFISRLKFKELYKNILWISIAIILHFVTTNKCMQIMGLSGCISDLLGIILLKYFIFFILGTLTKKSFPLFQKYEKHNMFRTIIIIMFFLPLIPIMKYNLASINIWYDHLIFLYFGTLGIYLVFQYFSKYQTIFSKQSKIGKTLQFIGKRTLDIYLLHYFFLPRNLEWLGTYFTGFKNSSIELFLSLCISLIVISISLVMSSIIRTSPFLGKNLFGMKPNVSNNNNISIND